MGNVYIERDAKCRFAGSLCKTIRFASKGPHELAWAKLNFNDTFVEFGLFDTQTPADLGAVCHFMPNQLRVSGGNRFADCKKNTQGRKVSAVAIVTRQWHGPSSR